MGSESVDNKENEMHPDIRFVPILYAIHRRFFRAFQYF